MPEPTEPIVEPTEPVIEPHGEPKETIDWKQESRKWEARAKENKSAASELEEIKKAQMSELEKAQAEAEQAKAEAAKLKADMERKEALKVAAKQAGVDEELLSLMAGDTTEQINANAETLKAKITAMPIYPSVNDNGASGTPVITREEIDKIKDPVARVKKRAEHPGLYI